MRSYKQKCIVCRKNYAMVTWKDRNPVCTECRMRDINKPIADKKFKKLFDIDKVLYEKSSFLRNIKSSYLRFGGLSDKQVEVFRKVAEELKSGKAKRKQDREIPEATEADL